MRDNYFHTIEDRRRYTDKYFIRGREILERDGLNPMVRYRYFVRKGPGIVKGVEEAAAFIKENAPYSKIFILPDGSPYNPCDTLMVVEGFIQDLIELETISLGIISGAMTSKYFCESEVRKTASDIVRLADGIPVYYGGARHFGWNFDGTISRICQEVGMTGCSTEAIPSRTAQNFDIKAMDGSVVLKACEAWQSGIGTIPHALIVVYGSTVAAARAFDKYISREVPRIVLIDTYNKEIDDSLAVARELGYGSRLNSVRIDTCGENFSQYGNFDFDMRDFFKKYSWPNEIEKYWGGTGVTINGVAQLRLSLDAGGFDKVGITVSSGFGPEKTWIFALANSRFKQYFGRPLFNSILTGSVWPDITMATADIVEKMTENGDWVICAKKGRHKTLDYGKIKEF